MCSSDLFPSHDRGGYGSFIGSGNTKKKDITMQYLGLDTTSLSDSRNPLIYGTSINLNLLPIFAYQKIYFDFFSNTQWEKHLAYSYNVDYWDGKSSVEISSDMIKLRYANYPKDYFLGVLPSSQYGSVAILPSVYDSTNSSNSVMVTSSVDPFNNPHVGTVVNSPSSTSIVSSNSFPSLRIRFFTFHEIATFFKESERCSRAGSKRAA